KKTKNFKSKKGRKIVDVVSSHHSGSEDYCTIKNAKIGSYVSMADFVSVGVIEPDLDKISTSSFLNDKEKIPQTIIKNDVWFGVDSVIKSGITIGNGAVIGANSYVREDVPDFAVVGGCPAKIIKYRFDEKTQENILKSQYWKYEPQKAREIISKLQKEYDENK
ncbi:antibiotic acetyltransferase, partial [bacterium]|nr:antibiotic acetyltransferase [bacterium]